jgi:L-ascorbate metabolism protein UlaG (beta-lactamase superfamily)
MEIKGVKIDWLGHAGFLIKGSSASVCIDPYQVKYSEHVDVIVCTHDHYDHCSPEDVKKFYGERTVVVCNARTAEKLSGMNVKVVQVGDVLEVSGVRVHAVDAYNLDKPFHPKGTGIGVLLDLDGTTIYHAGDTDLIPEMEDLAGKVDVALLPVSGTYVMNAEEAAKAASVINPQVAVPMHYGAGVVGTQKDAERFKELYAGRVEILLPRE